MTENKLRKLVRALVKESLEDRNARKNVTRTLTKVEKLPSVKMLKKALSTGSPVQQATGLYKVVVAISGDNPVVAKNLARMLQTGGIAAPGESGPEKVDESGLSDNYKPITKQLAKVDNTPAMKQLKKQLVNKPASAQAEFALDLLKGLDLKDDARRRLKMMLNISEVKH